MVLKSETMWHQAFRCLLSMTRFPEWELHIKKEAKYKERTQHARDDFQKEVAALAPKDLVYIYESGVDDNLTVEYGWAQKGQRSYAEQSGFRKQRLTLISGYCPNTKQLFAPL